jgi:hypothetical protein
VQPLRPRKDELRAGESHPGRGRGDGRPRVFPRRDLVSGSLSGGVAPSGIEHWIVTAGGEPEEIDADAFLTVFSARDAHGYCEFALRGRLQINLHG